MTPRHAGISRLAVPLPHQEQGEGSHRKGTMSIRNETSMKRLGLPKVLYSRQLAGAARDVWQRVYS